MRRWTPGVCGRAGRLLLPGEVFKPSARDPQRRGRGISGVRCPGRRVPASSAGFRAVGRGGRPPGIGAASSEGRRRLGGRVARCSDAGMRVGVEPLSRRGGGAAAASVGARTRRRRKGADMGVPPGTCAGVGLGRQSPGDLTGSVRGARKRGYGGREGRLRETSVDLRRGGECVSR